jgi:hypothetical protein
MYIRYNVCYIAMYRPIARQRSCKIFATVMEAEFSITCYSSLLGRAIIHATVGFLCVPAHARVQVFSMWSGPSNSIRAVFPMWSATCLYNGRLFLAQMTSTEEYIVKKQGDRRRNERQTS